MPEKNIHKEVSELRRDPVSKEWVVIATGRSKRPDAFKVKRAKFQQPRKKCPFCHIEKSGTPDPVMLYPLNLRTKFAQRLKQKGDLQKWNNKIWSLIVVPNKFPSFVAGDTLSAGREGLHEVLPGRGHHEVLITAAHDLHFGLLPEEKIEEALKAYQERYIALSKDKFVHYISIFHNHGPEAGASLYHPHSQILAIPVMPRDVHNSLRGSMQYYKKNKRCVHCDMLSWERKMKKRIIFENKDFIVVCPFSASVAFETRIYPKKHSSYFEEITPRERKSLAQCFKVSLYKLYRVLNNPPYNFFLHTAPCDGLYVEKGARKGIKNKKKYSHYHWHFEIHPKISIWAGFELSTGIEISTVEPTRAAEMLKKFK